MLNVWRSRHNIVILVLVISVLLLGRWTITATLVWGEDNWQRLQVEAKKEGTLVIYTSSGPEVRQTISPVFKKNFGINLEWAMGRSGEMTGKMLNEQRAGLYIPDVWFAGSSNIPELKGAGALQSLDTVLFLPEVLDKKVWFGGKLSWCDDPGHNWAGILAYPVPSVVINTQLVKPDDVKSYRDLLNPKWKGKIVINDPTKSGAGASWFSAMVQGIMDLDYMREFVKQQPLLLDNARQQIEWVARGKYPIGAATRGEQRTEFVNQGFPIDMITPVEGVHLTSSAGVSMMKRAPHPNATKLFINWLLTKEGATLVSKAVGGQSARLDVPNDFCPPEMRRQPGVKYFSTLGWDYVVSLDKMLDLAKEVFAPVLMK